MTLNVTFEPGQVEGMTQLFEKERMNFPTLSMRDYFTDPEKALAPHMQQGRHLLAFKFKLQPDGPDRVWYFIKTGEVARKILNAPRYGIQQSGHPWGEGPHTAILRSALAVSSSPKAGTNNVMTTRADTHKQFRKPLIEELRTRKGLNEYIPRLAECIHKLLPANIEDLSCDINLFCRTVVQETVLDLVGLPSNTVTMEEISKLNAIAHEMAKGVEGAPERMRHLRISIDNKVIEGFESLREHSLFEVLQKSKGYSQVACRETIIALMIGARNGSTTLIHLLWLLSRNPEMQAAVKQEFVQANQEKTDWTKSIDNMPMLRNLFRYSLVTHSPIKTMNRNAINPMILTVTDGDKEQSYGIFSGDRVDYLMSEAAKTTQVHSPLTDEVPLSHLPFGVGPNQCPASQLIEVITMLTAGMIVNRFQLTSEAEKPNVVPNVFTNEFVDEPLIVQLRGHICPFH